VASSIWIQDRDKEILRGAFEHKVLDLESIHRLAFKDVHLEIARRRALKLCAYGYLDRIPFLRGGKHFSVFSPTEKGVSQIRKDYAGEMVLRTLKSQCIEHDLILFQIRRRLECLSMVKRYFTENMLQTLMALKNSNDFREFARLRSDAACTIKGKSGDLNIAIEFENSEQSNSRYESKFKDYYIRSEIDLVFYICARAHSLKNLGEIDHAIRGSGKHKIFFCSLENVLKPTEKLIFENFSKAKVALN
jgi:hypothetical protein